MDPSMHFMNLSIGILLEQHLDKRKLRVHETTKQTGTPNKNKRLIDTKKHMPFFLYTPPTTLSFFVPPSYALLL